MLSHLRFIPPRHSSHEYSAASTKLTQGTASRRREEQSNVQADFILFAQNDGAASAIYFVMLIHRIITSRCGAGVVHSRPSPDSTTDLISRCGRYSQLLS